MIHLVDDDPGVRSSLAWAFAPANLPFMAHATPEEFLSHCKPDEPGCLILDLHLERTHGLPFLRQLRANGCCKLPVIVVTGTGDVPSAVQCMKLGVVEFLEKPVDPAVLIALARDALAADATRIKAEADSAEIDRRFESLTFRERELVPLICSGLSSKQIAGKLNLSVRTVMNHRAHLLEKVRAENTADLVRLASARTWQSPEPAAIREGSQIDGSPGE
jgi:FixJ family two-component response regulator